MKNPLLAAGFFMGVRAVENRRVGKFLAHAVIVGGKIIEPESGADNNHRVGRICPPYEARQRDLY
ncbi:hypothetical protein [Telluria aromaticivorans]|uniref:Uncharacterized protein n=1 Tax=Telluria aromaticivorans TaxID=2725995 RepID=A0A7Y2P183_9BURK|nr:hypothetical protein [Telluria aromaticivorans]NNG24296.1 hypothetical protein [Telluria aromaticivorans]